MAEYLAPGVYIEETSFRSKSIEGVSTSTTAFVGPARRGPVSGTPELLTSVADFERIYGGPNGLSFSDNGDGRNYLALAVTAYFENGGSRLYVARVFEPSSSTDSGTASKEVVTGKVTISARFPGKAGEGTVTISEDRTKVSGSAVANLPVGTMVAIPGATATDPETFAVLTATGWSNGTGSVTVTSGEVLTFSLTASDTDGHTQVFEGLGYHPSHPRFVALAVPTNPTRRLEQLQNMVAVTVDSTVTAFALRTALLGGPHSLTGGNDGAKPTSTRYKNALANLERLDDISIVAAPGATEYDPAVRGELLTHVHKKGLYRIAILDSSKDDAVSEIRDTRGAIDSHRAALYYPWVTISNPLSRPGDAQQPREINVPPSGFIAGIYARNDAERGVFKSPANEVVRGAVRFETDISLGENELLNPLGVNCLRYFPGRGYRVWGARTTTSDPEWKYVSVRRYFNFVEASIERGTQWAVFEPNGPALWANIRETISSFLYNEWRSGALLGATEKEAYFVRCDLTTMTQNDLDNGRLICLVGVAVVKPAEFVVFRIGQKTATARD